MSDIIWMYYLLFSTWPTCVYVLHARRGGGGGGGGGWLMMICRWWFSTDYHSKCPCSSQYKIIIIKGHVNLTIRLHSCMSVVGWNKFWETLTCVILVIISMEAEKDNFRAGDPQWEFAVKVPRWRSAVRVRSEGSAVKAPQWKSPQWKSPHWKFQPIFNSK